MKMMLVKLCVYVPEDGVIFTVAFNQNWSVPNAPNYTVIINELEIQYDEMFYEFIHPFLTKIYCKHGICCWITTTQIMSNG